MEKFFQETKQHLISSIFMLSLLAVVGCGGSADDEQTSPRQILPSDDFYQVCADPSTAYHREIATKGTYVDENNWLRSFTYETYLWYDEVEDRDPACCSTPEYFELMKTFETTPSGNPKDQFHFSTNTKEYLESQRGVDFGYGFSLGITQEGYFILYVEPNSPADNAGLRRGMRILEIDGVPIEQVSNLGSSKPERREFTVLRFGESQPFSVTMTSKEIVKTPVQWNVLENRDSGYRVGYMLFNDHIPPAEPALISAVEYFDFQDIDDLVLDLRYNGGGAIYLANGLAFMIAGPRATENKLFLETIYNGKRPSEPSPFYSISSIGLPLPSLNLERVFVLTASHTCSASEAIINGLRGIDVEVVLIGDTTCGKPYGFVPEDNCGTTYFTIQFRAVNDKGFGSYEDGFRPTCRARDDIRHPLGDPGEAVLETALYYTTFGQCPTSQQATKSDEGAAAKVKVPSDQLEPPDIIEIWPPVIPRMIPD